jgi:hypothetical protein
VLNFAAPIVQVHDLALNSLGLSGSLRRKRMILSMELAVVLFRFEHPCEIRYAIGSKL